MHLQSVRAGHPAQPAQPEGSADQAIAYLDPLDDDLTWDPHVELSHRQLGRLLFIAAETGARFQREEVSYDPMAWMFSPRALFDGQAAADACQRREPFVRAMLLHGLSLGIDADPEELDALIVDDIDIAPDLPASNRSKQRTARRARVVELSPA